MLTESPNWFKSSYSDNGGTCVEAAANLVATHGTVPVRDSKNPAGPVLDFPVAAFGHFVSSVKSGKFN
ncbi:DUF397 domain-containing protein [Streptomyces sp. NPDC094437]|uniref:DUF397 domain-containing protein n=1 Tax=Streptomyces sp. NPDC094437 TaxID=3366060 RepID=UPI0038288953